MGRIGDRLKKAYRKVGLSYVIERDTGDISGEYGMINPNRQVTKPFIREFFQDARFPYDSAIQSGDIISVDDGRKLMVMNLTPSIIKNQIIEKESVLYKCNVSGQLVRFSGELSYDSNYNLGIQELVIRDNCYGLLTEALYGNEMTEDRDIQELMGMKSNELYVPASVGIQIGDRYYVTAAEYYRIETVATRKYDNVHVATIAQDTR